eukprot:7625963-Heterocapsa_arctica.AAC.1
MQFQGGQGKGYEDKFLGLPGMAWAVCGPSAAGGAGQAGQAVLCGDRPWATAAEDGRPGSA